MNRYRSLPAITFGLFVAIAIGAYAQDGMDKRGRERFESLSWLEGEWQGYGKFSDRVTYIRKHYSFDIGGVYFVERTIDMFPPPEPSVEFEMHQDMTLFYRASDDSPVRAKGFFVEGFIISSSVVIKDDGNKVIMTSEEIENAPPGMRTRYTMVRQGADKYVGVFEMAMPDKDFSEVERLELKRIF